MLIKNTIINTWIYSHISFSLFSWMVWYQNYTWLMYSNTPIFSFCQAEESPSTTEMPWSILVSQSTILFEIKLTLRYRVYLLYEISLLVVKNLDITFDCLLFFSDTILFRVVLFEYQNTDNICDVTLYIFISISPIYL